MKNFLTIVMSCLFLLSAANALAAEKPFTQITYEVKKGDWLSKIGNRFGVSYQQIAKDNSISNPDLIFPKQRLIIRKAATDSKRIAPVKKVTSVKKSVASKKSIIRTVSIKIKEALFDLFQDPELIVPQLKGQQDILKYGTPGGDKCRNGLDRALVMLGYPQDAAEALKQKVIAKDFAWTEIGIGDTFLMTFGKGKVKLSEGAWLNEKSSVSNNLLAAKEYTVEIDGRTWSLAYILWCGNWVRMPDKKVVIVPPPVIPTGDTPTTTQPSDEASASDWCFDEEHEPIVGAGRWRNRLARGRFAYGEYMLWLKECGSEWSYGVGLYGAIEDGQSKTSNYKWDGHLIGPQAGTKWTSTYMNDEDEVFFQQFQLKVRLVWEKIDGRNRKSGYSMHQDAIKLGFYSEYVRELNKKWIGILTAEGWIGFNESISSTWSGDSPSSRNMFGMGAYAQYRATDNVQFRFGGGPFYQRWDKMTGINLRAEVRFWETVMIGPYFNFFPFRLSDEYRDGGYSKSDLNTWGIFARVEFGGIFRAIDRNRRQNQVRPVSLREVGITEEDITEL